MSRDHKKWKIMVKRGTGEYSVEFRGDGTQIIQRESDSHSQPCLVTDNKLGDHVMQWARKNLPRDEQIEFLLALVKAIQYAHKNNDDPGLGSSKS